MLLKNKFFFVFKNQCIFSKFAKKLFCESGLVEPREYRTMYIEDLPNDWDEEIIKERMEQIGKVEDFHIVRNSIGENLGKVIVTYSKVENVIKAIELFSGKIPFVNPLQPKFFRNKAKAILSKESRDVLLIKNIPFDLHKKELIDYLTQFGEQPLYIAYPRDHKNNFKGIAYVYYASNQEAKKVFGYINLRYIDNRQIFVEYARNYYDIADFRTRIEFGVKLSPFMEYKLLQKQIYLIKSQRNELEKELKIEFLNRKIRELEVKHDLKNYNQKLLEEDKKGLKSKYSFKINSSIQKRLI